VFSLVFVGGALFATLGLTFTAEMEFGQAVATVLRRVARSVAFRQLVVIAGAILVLRYGMNNFLMALSKFSSSPVQWDKTKLYYILREVYQPLELLLFIAALCTVADAFVPSLIAVPKATVSHVVKSILSSSFILGFGSVVFNLKSRFCKENAWQAEMKGDVTSQRRWEAYDKMGSFIIYVMSFVLGIQSIGLEVTSVLAIGGIGGLAIGLAGREICENLLNGFLIMSTNPFEVGDEVTFFHNNKVVEGFVIDIGWYRTLIRSFEREVYVVPNAVFSKNIVLNVSRKNREWRFYEMLSIRVQDVQKANAIVQDIRRIVRNDTRVINKLHRRVFLDKITPDDARIYLSFYLEGANRDAFMAIKQDLLVSFVDCVERNGAKLATPRTVVDMDPEMADMINTISPIMQGASAFAMAQSMAQAQAGMVTKQLPGPPTITAEATTIPHSGAGGPMSAGQPTAVGAAVVSGSNGASANGTTSGAAAAAGAGSSGTAGSGAAQGSPEKQPAQPAGGSPLKAGSPSPSRSSTPEVKVVAAGGKVGEVYTAVPVAAVVAVPVAAPVAYAGGISNNVVSAGPIASPAKAPASKDSNGSSGSNGTGSSGSSGAPPASASKPAARAPAAPPAAGSPDQGGGGLQGGWLQDMVHSGLKKLASVMFEQ